MCSDTHPPPPYVRGPPKKFDELIFTTQPQPTDEPTDEPADATWSAAAANDATRSSACCQGNMQDPDVSARRRQRWLL